MHMLPGGYEQSGACAERFEALEQRIEHMETSYDKSWDVLQKIAQDTAHLKGRIAGYLLAASMLGSIVAFLAMKVVK